MIKKILKYLGISLIIVILVASCAEPTKMSMPPPIGGGSPPPLKSKMCVGDKCREMGAVDGGGTTRGHSDDKND